MSEVKATLKFVSLEPLLECVEFERPEVFDWFIIGNQNGTRYCPEVQPELEWVETAIMQARGARALVYCKSGLKVEGLKEAPKEYPVLKGDQMGLF